MGVGESLRSIWHWLHFADPRFSKDELWTQVRYLRDWRDPGKLLGGRRSLMRVCITYRCDRDCEFCYARGLGRRFPGDMSPEDFGKALDWGKRNGCSRVRLVGGEPAVHPRFSEVLGICAEKGFSVGLFSNGLFGAEVREALRAPPLREVTFNFAFGELDDGQRKRFRSNAAALRERGVFLGFSSVLKFRDPDWELWASTLEELRPAYLWTSFPQPGAERQTEGAEVLDSLPGLIERAMRMQEICVRARIPFFFFRPIPSCAMTPVRRERLLKSFPNLLHARCPLGSRGDYSSMAVINPDLTVMPCSSVSAGTARLEEFEDWAQMSERFRPTVRPLQEAPLAGACRGCRSREAFLRSLDGAPGKGSGDSPPCQGGCLNFRPDSSSE